MHWMSYRKSIFSWQAAKKLINVFLQILGIISLIISIISILFPDALHFGYSGTILFICIALIGGIIAINPKNEISHTLLVPDTKITITVGDLFAQEARNIVIGMNDVFETEIGDFLKASSIHGQFVTKVYQNDRMHLDHDLDQALQVMKSTGRIDTQKIRGKNKRYPIGTVITLVHGTKRYFCCAYSRIGTNLKCESDIKRLSVTLDKLWEEVRVKGQHDKVAMAVVGSEGARIGNASHADLIKLIILSFILASREKLVAPELLIVLHQSNLGKVNMFELADFLRTFV